MKKNFQTIKKALSDEMLRNTIFVTFINTFGALLNYMIHPILTRFLAVEEYGDFQTLLSIHLILAFPFGAFILAISNETAQHFFSKKIHNIKLLQKNLSKRFIKWGLLLYIFFIPMNFYLASIFKIDSPLYLFMISTIFISGSFVILNRGIFQGTKHFVSFSSNIFFEHCIKFLTILLLVYLLTWGLFGAVLALITGPIFALIIGLKQVRNILSTNNNTEEINEEVSYNMKPLVQYASFIFCIGLCFSLFFNIDMLAAKYFLSEKEAGYYASLLILGRIIFFIGGALPIIIFPNVIEQAHDNKKHGKMLFKALGILLILVLPVTLIFIFLPKQLIYILIGNQYIENARYLPYFTVPMVFISMMYILKNYFLALKNKTFIFFLLFGLILEICLILILPKSIMNIVFSMSLGIGISVAGMILYALKNFFAPQYISKNKRHEN